MVSIRICRQLENLLIKRFSKRQDFFSKHIWVLANDLNQSLHCPCSVDVSRYLGYLWYYCVDKLFETVDWADFDQFLAEVVAELVSHDIW